ncbi:MAG: radical SAM family heme chaperone HemW, partial [Candidatus Eiseniibacteriota bacterium]
MTPAPGPGAAARRQALTGLYVHVPFCAVRCHYCDFSSGALSAAAIERYLAAMAVEMRMREPAACGMRFHSVFFGGGTPSALGPAAFERLVRLLRGHFDLAPGAEITLEANPETVDERKLEAWCTGGVNRLSMGAQSFHGDELRRLGRVHDADRPARAAAMARAHGFTRLSLDLMFGYPGHDQRRFEASLERALSCGIEHLSAYCFIPEAGTPLGDQTLRDPASLPGPEREAELYAVAERVLGAAGFACYETSNFCRPDAEARHNLVYWLRRPYLGLGPSAHSLIAGERFANHYAFTRWAADLEHGRLPEAERERESDASVAQEILLLGLRLGGGVDPADHPAETWRAVRDRFGEALELAVHAGRLERVHGAYRIPEWARFVADEAIAWILARESASKVRTRRFDTVP